MKYSSIFLILFFSSQNLFANIIGSDLENFNPTVDGLGYVTTESAETLDTGRFNLGLFLDYSANILPTLNNVGIEPNDRLVTGNFHGAIGIMEGWSFGMSLTALISEEVNQASFATQFSDTGGEAFRFDNKIRFYNAGDVQMAALVSINFNQITDNPYLGRDPGPSFFLGGSYEQILSETLRWAVNLGYRMRNAGDTIAGSSIPPIKDQVVYSGAVNYRYQDLKTNFIGEIYGATPTESPNNLTNREFSILEILLGARWDLSPNFQAHAGITRGVYEGLSTPDFRIYGGVNWFFGPFTGQYETMRIDDKGGGPDYNADLDSDGDGVVDSLDSCPNTPAQTVVDARGCPRLEADDDGDGVLNDVDECPNTALGAQVNSAGCEVVVYAKASGDEDEDGVLDDYDLCPGTPRGVKVTERGCEAKKIQKFDMGDLNFITATDKLTKNSRARFIKKLNYLYQKRNSVQRIVIEGHTDNVGKRAYNQDLSQRRANTVKRIIVKHAKVPSKKIKSVGYGEDRPMATNKTKAGRLKNRRVDMHLILN